MEGHDYQSQVSAWREAPEAIPALNEILPNSKPSSGSTNLTVAVRCRPVLPTDCVGELIPSTRASSESVTNFESISILDAFPTSVYLHQEESFAGLPSGQIKTSRYDINKSVGNDRSDAAMFQDLLQPLCQRLVESAEDCTVWFINYGMTGSGKTYTSMEAYHFITRLLFASFVCIDNSCQLQLSVVELRGDDCYDLLDRVDTTIEPIPEYADCIPNITRKKVPVRESEAGEICIPSKTVNLKDPGDASVWLELAMRHRRTSSTSTNEASSRSHAIITLWLCALNGHADVKRRFKIVDLAGSERQKEAMYHSREQLNEMKAINYSLGCLKECLRANATGTSGHIPYRNSKLTLVLRDAFAASDRVITNRSVLFLAHLGPSRASLLHSVNTLEFVTSMISVSTIEKRAASFSGPEAWSTVQVQKFIRELNDGAVKHLESSFHITGKRLSTEWIGHLERRVLAAGGTVEEAHLIYDSFYALRKEYKNSIHNEKGRSTRRQAGGSGKLAEVRRQQRLKFSSRMQSAIDVVSVAAKDSATTEAAAGSITTEDTYSKGTNGI